MRPHGPHGAHGAPWGPWGKVPGGFGGPLGQGATAPWALGPGTTAPWAQGPRPFGPWAQGATNSPLGPRGCLPAAFRAQGPGRAAGLACRRSGLPAVLGPS